MDSEMIVEIGQIAVAIILSGGMVALVLTGKPTDGVAPGFLAVLGFLYGGAVVKSSAVKSAITAGQTAVNAISAASSATHTVAADVQTAANSLVAPVESPAAPPAPTN